MGYLHPHKSGNVQHSRHNTTAEIQETKCNTSTRHVVPPPTNGHYPPHRRSGDQHPLPVSEKTLHALFTCFIGEILGTRFGLSSKDDPLISCVSYYLPRASVCVGLEGRMPPHSRNLVLRRLPQNGVGAILIVGNTHCGFRFGGTGTHQHLYISSTIHCTVVM